MFVNGGMLIIIHYYQMHGVSNSSEALGQREVDPVLSSLTKWDLALMPEDGQNH